MLHFQHIQYLWALGAVPFMVVLYYIVIKGKKNTIKKIGDPALVNQLIKDDIFDFIIRLKGFAESL